MSNDLSSGHYQIVPVSIELRTKHFYVVNTEPPQLAESVANKDVLNYALPQGRVEVI